MATDDGWALPREEPSWDGPVFGRFGVLAEGPDGDTVQCHVCGDWFVLLGTHANKAHGLGADAREVCGKTMTWCSAERTAASCLRSG
jgi:hypothetical protein